MEIKVQVTLKGEVAEKFAASMAENYRTIAGEAAFRITDSLKRGSEVALRDGQSAGGDV